MEFNPALIADFAVPYITRVLGALALLAGAWLVAGWMRRNVRRGLARAHVDETLSIFLGNSTRWTVLVLALLAALTVFGIEVTTFAAVIGAAGLAIGLAFQGTLSNFASGIMLLVFRPFGVGDVVTAAGIKGKVAEVQIFTTIFDTADNRRIFVPNSHIFGDVIENDTFHEIRRVDVKVGASYDADIDATREALESAVAAVEGVLAEPAHQVYLNELGGSSVDWVVKVWAATPDYWAVREHLTRAIKVALDAAGIGIPYPQMDVHLDGRLQRD